jgi:hypothetical protein
MTTNTQLLETSCSFWSLSQAEQLAIAQQVPKQDAWTLSVRRNLDGTWEFDIPEFQTFNELFIGNTEKVLDIHYNTLSDCPPDEYSTMDITVSRIPIADETTSCDFVRPCTDAMGASIYLDVFSNQEFWLCPYLQVLFKDAPKNLYVKMDVTS